MSGPAGAKITPLLLKGIRVTWPRVVAMRLDHVVVIEGRDLVLSLSLEDAGPRVIVMKNLGYRAGRVAISKTRKFMLISNDTQNWFEVRSTKTLDVIASFSAPDPFSCAFAADAGEDVLVAALRPGLIDVYTLPEGALAGRVHCARPKPFVTTQLLGVGDSETVGVVGHPYLELKCGPLFCKTALLKGKDATFIEDLEAIMKNGMASAAVGSCGWEEVIVYEAPSPSRERPQPEAALITRKLSDSGRPGEVLERIPYSKPVAAGTALMATSLVVALGHEGGIDVVPRAALQETGGFVAARVHGFDPEAGRILYVAPEGGLHVLDLPRM